MFKSLLLKLKLMGSKLWTFLKPVIMAFLSDIGDDLADMALDAVKTLAATDLTDAEKRAQAFDVIKANLKAKGLEVKDSLINLAIECAVQALKSDD